MLSKTTELCKFTLPIHTTISSLLKSFFTPNNDDLYQSKLGDNVFWSFMCAKRVIDFIGRLEVIEESEEEVIIKVTEINDSTIITPNVFPNISDKSVLRLRIQNGIISLKPLELDQTSFTFYAKIDLEEVKCTLSHNDDTVNSSGRDDSDIYVNNVISVNPKDDSRLGIDKSRIFTKIGQLFYQRFEQEAVIDRRKTLDFISKIPDATKLTDPEKILIMEWIDLNEKIGFKGKRVVGSANDKVEKFTYKEGRMVWGVSVAQIDAPAVTLFASLWVLDTYEKRKQNKDMRIRHIVPNIDGTRGLQYSCSVSLPGGFQDRLFSGWLTWARRTNKDGRATYIIAITPIEEYCGTKYRIEGAEDFMGATSKGVYVIREITENTCEWTRVQNVDLKLTSIPVSILEFYTVNELNWANDVQEKYKRNNKDVDRERVESIAELMIACRNKPLMKDQASVYKRCVMLLGDKNSQNEWHDLEDSSCPDVTMTMKYFPLKRGERSVAIEKGVGVVDCSVEEVVAWQMDYCSNAKMLIHKEEGHPARLELRKKARVNENSYATVKKFPFTLHNREFVFRQFWKSEPGKAVIALESISDAVDYGTSLRKTRGFVRSLWQVEELPTRGGIKQCRVTFVTQLDAGGFIPTWVVNKQVPSQLKVVQEAINGFKQDKQIDTASVSDLATYMKDHWQDQTYSAQEDALLQRARLKFEDSLRNKHWKKLKSPDPFVTMDSTMYEDRGNFASIAIGRTSTIVDATPEECAALEYAKDTRERMQRHYNPFGIGSKMLKLNEHSLIYHVIYEISERISPREWLTKFVWKMEDGGNTIVICFEDVDHDDFPVGAGKGYVRASSSGFMRYTRLPTKLPGSIPQTSITYYQQVDLKGYLPTFFIKIKIIKQLSHLSAMRKKFDRSLEIDAGRRAELVKRIKESPKSGPAPLTQVATMFTSRHHCERPTRSFGLADSIVEHGHIGGNTWGKTTLVFRAEIEEVSAFFWDFGSRANIEISCDVHRYAPAEILSNNFNFTQITKRTHKLASAHHAHHRDRLYETTMTLDVIDEDTIVILVSPHQCTELEPAQINSNESGLSRDRKTIIAETLTLTLRKIKYDTTAIPARETTAIRISRLGKRTKVEYATHLDLGISVSGLASKHTVERRLEEVAEASIYFQRLVPLKQYDHDDGQALGHDLLWKAHSSKARVERFKEVLKKNSALKELETIHPWFEVMMTSALRGSLSMNRVVKTKLACVNLKEAAQIGRNLVPSLKSKKLIDAGVDQWRVQNRPVKELMEERTWFQPMTVVLGKGIVKSAAWGLLWRVTIGALMSVGDLATDILVLKQFWDEGEKMSTYRNLTLASLVASFGLQLVLVSIQNRHKGLFRISMEAFIVIVGLKPSVDAYRVATGAVQESRTQFDPMMEMTFTKGIELFTESIPGMLIQSSAILSTLETVNEQVSNLAYISILTSMLTTGFTAATLSYDFDTDPKRRAKNSEFYGYVPDSAKKRTVLFFTMINLSAVQVLIKSMFITTLAFKNFSYAWLYLGADMFFYLAVKVLRRDFAYWPQLYGLTGFAVACLGRVATKLVADFTSCFQFRHPYEVGGLPFTLNMLTPLIGMLALLALLEEDAMNAETLEFLNTLTFVAGLALICLLVTFLLLIEKDYLKTFFSLKTGSQLTVTMFLEGDDVSKAGAVTTNKAHLEPILGKIEVWIKTGWKKWEEEKPDWFNDTWKANLPKELIPEKLQEGLSPAATPQQPQKKLEAPIKAPIPLVVKGTSAVFRRKITQVKIAPALPSGSKTLSGEQEQIDVEEFKREMRRRGSVSM
ncbi:hypothetical protein TL16_g09884 [Triparma laevis f. inornata]|uniref:START domain-containing protein n=1 Tax=Triparma laevis f. inornata TaxID=1714386 RepID=A0A9W7BCL8_9STRA|nr:hypothetical protein TL16_g09884 [Triparma laevis f. inornata]